MDNLATPLISRSSAPTRRRLNVLNNAYARPLFGGSIHSFHQPAATFSAASTDKTTAANAIKEPQKKWYSFATDPIKKAWRKVKKWFFSLGVSMIATPLKHLFLRPTLMRKVMPHDNVVLDNPLQKELIDKKYELSKTYELIHGTVFKSLDKSKNIFLNGHWLLPRNKKPTYITVMCNGVGADWTYQLALAEKLVDDGAMVMMYNNRGHRENDKELCTMGVHEAKDLAAAIIHADLSHHEILNTELSKRNEEDKPQWDNTNKPPFYVYGHSMGGATIMYLAKSLVQKDLKTVNQIVDGFIYDAPYAKMDVFSFIPHSVESALTDFSNNHWAGKILSEPHEFKLFNKTKTYGPWLTSKKIDKVSKGPLVEAVTDRLNKELLREIDIEGSALTQVNHLDKLVPGKLITKKANIDARYNNNETQTLLNKAMLYMAAVDGSDETITNDSMELNTTPINTLRDKNNPIETVKLYGYAHNAKTWTPFADLDKEVIHSIVNNKKLENLWDGLEATTSLRPAALSADNVNDPDTHSEAVQVKLITEFIKKTKAAKAS